MIVVTNNSFNYMVFGNTIKTLDTDSSCLLDKYNEELKYKLRMYSHLDIMKVYKIKDFKKYSVNFFIKNIEEISEASNNEVQLIWQRDKVDKKIDWEKVPPFTKVLINNYRDIWEKAYFLESYETADGIFCCTTFCDKFTHNENKSNYFVCREGNVKLYHEDDGNKEYY